MGNITFEITEFNREYFNLSRTVFEPFSVTNEGVDGPDYYLISSSLISEQDNDQVLFSKIKSLTHFFIGALRITAQTDSFGNISTFPNFQIKSVYKNENAIPLPNFEEVAFLDLTHSNSGINYDDKSGHYIHKVLDRSLKDRDIFNILLICSDRFDYVDLYKVHEILKTKNISTILKKYSSQIQDFTYSANNFSATGFASRHGPNNKGAVSSKRKFISLGDSRQLFRDIFKDYMATF